MYLTELVCPAGKWTKMEGHANLPALLYCCYLCCSCFALLFVCVLFCCWPKLQLRAVSSYQPRSSPLLSIPVYPVVELECFGVFGQTAREREGIFPLLSRLSPKLSLPLFYRFLLFLPLSSHPLFAAVIVCKSSRNGLQEVGTYISVNCEPWNG